MARFIKVPNSQQEWAVNADQVTDIRKEGDTTVRVWTACDAGKSAQIDCGDQEGRDAFYDMVIGAAG